MNKSNSFLDIYNGISCSARAAHGAIVDPSQFDGIEDDLDFIIDEGNVPILPLRNMVVFPMIHLPLSLGRDSSKLLANEAAESKELVFLVAQKDANVETPKASDLHRIGVVARIMKVMELPDGTMTALCVALGRARLRKVSKKSPYLRGAIEPELDIIPEDDDLAFDATLATIAETFSHILNLIGEDNTRELRFALSQMDTNLRMFNFICCNAPISTDEKQQLLDERIYAKRMEMLLSALDRAVQLLEIKLEIEQRTHSDLSQQQKEHFLHQQMRTIRDELGAAAEEDEIAELRARAEKMCWSPEAGKHFEKELAKLQRFNPSNPEYAIQYSYIDTLLNLPWNKTSETKVNLDKVEEILNRDHYALDKVKERILEHMAVLKLRKDMKAPILCLYGAPGVGKTSLGRSIAEAIGREYSRISLGGLHDEAEIRGHRRTYMGAMPGRIISALTKCGTSNPVIVLDEIDKIGKDYKGDPAQALLEVLDPEQNSKFHDNYVDFDYDLSNILFIATANSLAPLSSPLLDRMEVIEVSGYITEEKAEIARLHLVPKVLKEHGFEADEISITPEALRYIIERYTREAGVRQLEKRIAKLLRKIARLKASDREYPRTLTVDHISEYLGKEEVNPDMYENNDNIGVVTGLAWTSVGGEILFIESALSEGKGALSLTGNLGDVMKESSTLALQYIKANANTLGIDPKTFTTHDVHIHVPEGAIPKDGPSAGITMVTSLVSSYTGRKVRSHLAMTGEITLRGKVLPVGGIKEKILAAKRSGITDIILSEENRKDIAEIGSQYLEGLTFHHVNNISDVLRIALL